MSGQVLDEVLDELATFEPNLAATVRLLASRGHALHRDGLQEASEDLYRGFLDRWAPLGLNEATAIDAARWVRQWTPRERPRTVSRPDPWQTLVMVSAWRCARRAEAPVGLCWEVSGSWCDWCPTCAATVAVCAAVAAIVADSIEVLEQGDVDAAWALAELAWHDPHGAALHLDLWPA